MKLMRDERGALLVLGLLMAVALVAAVAYVIGIGDAVLQRERMQDAADTAAFSGAVLHARGMNVIALINQLMAALLAILVALKLVELLTIIAIVAIALASFFNPGLAATIPAVNQLRNGVKQAHDGLRQPIHGALEAMHVAAVGVRTLVPVASQLRLVAGSDQPDSPASAVLVLPMRLTLPTEDGTFPELCDHAGTYVGRLTQWTLEAGLPSAVASLVGDAAEDLSQSDASWFCGSGGSPPRTTVSETHHFPRLPEQAACEAVDPAAGGYEPDEHARLCAEAERVAAESKPDAEGNCVDHCEPGACRARCDDPGHPYYRLAAAARAQCSPEAGGRGDDLRKFTYQLRTFTRRYAAAGTGWRRVSSDDEERASEELRVQVGERLRPCGRRDAPIGAGWDDSPDADFPGRDTSRPVCIDAGPRGAPRPNEEESVTHHEVTHVFHCQRTRKRTYAPPDDQLEAGGEGKVPQRMLADATLGSEAFQLRAIVAGALPRAIHEDVLELASWDRDGEVPRFDAQRALGRVAVAQAEYFYDGEAGTSPGAYLWNMRWRARLRRFTWPSAAADASVDSGQSLFPAEAIETSLAAACTTLLPVTICDAVQAASAGLVH